MHSTRKNEFQSNDENNFNSDKSVNMKIQINSLSKVKEMKNKMKK